MEYRFLGKTGLKVSEICFGPGNNNIVEDGEGIRLLEEAFDTGITLYDTSNVEKDGKVETWLGKVFGGRRDGVVIASKFSGDATRKHIVRECEKSLKRLNTNYIDIYRFQGWTPTVALEESLEALTTLVQQGKILHIGCCSFKTFQIATALRVSDRYGFTPMMVIGARYCLLGQDPFTRYPLMEVQEFDLLPYLEMEQLGFVPYRALAGGILTGKYSPGETPPDGSRYAGTRYGQPDFVEKARLQIEVVEKLRPLAERREMTLAQFALAWVLSKPAVSSILVGANRPEQLRELVAASGQTLSLDELREVDAIREVLPGCVTIPSKREKQWMDLGYRLV